MFRKIFELIPPAPAKLIISFFTVLGIRDILVRIRMRIRDVQKHMDSKDPHQDADTEHW
jgi:hypothetical protein